MAQDRLAEKRSFQRLGIPTTRFAPVDSRGAARARACGASACPACSRRAASATTARASMCCAASADLDPAWQLLGSAPLLYEEFVPFEYEVSIIGVRARSGAIAIYPLNRNYHADGILRLTLAPWAAPRLARAAAGEPRRAARALQLCRCADASSSSCIAGGCWPMRWPPRVHNSGHWTIEGAVTSQFENHLRAIARPAARLTARARTLRHDQPDRHDARRAPASGRAGRALARLRQATTSRPQARPLHH